MNFMAWSGPRRLGEDPRARVFTRAGFRGEATRRGRGGVGLHQIALSMDGKRNEADRAGRRRGRRCAVRTVGWS